MWITVRCISEHRRHRKPDIQAASMLPMIYGYCPLVQIDNRLFVKDTTTRKYQPKIWIFFCLQYCLCIYLQITRHCLFTLAFQYDCKFSGKCQIVLYTSKNYRWFRFCCPGKNYRSVAVNLFCLYIWWNFLIISIFKMKIIF